MKYNVPAGGTAGGEELKAWCGGFLVDRFEDVVVGDELGKGSICFDDNFSLDACIFGGEEGGGFGLFCDRGEVPWWGVLGLVPVSLFALPFWGRGGGCFDGGRVVGASLGERGCCFWPS